jgi:hypothetical protein
MQAAGTRRTSVGHGEGPDPPLASGPHLCLSEPASVHRVAHAQAALVLEGAGRSCGGPRAGGAHQDRRLQREGQAAPRGLVAAVAAAATPAACGRSRPARTRRRLEDEAPQRLRLLAGVGEAALVADCGVAGGVCGKLEAPSRRLKREAVRCEDRGGVAAGGGGGGRCWRGAALVGRGARNAGTHWAGDGPEAVPREGAPHPRPPRALGTADRNQEGEGRSGDAVGLGAVACCGGPHQQRAGGAHVRIGAHRNGRRGQRQRDKSGKFHL